MTVRLRPHHLNCLLTYIGEGYSPAFTANYDVIAGRIGAGEDILVVDGPDDICAPLLNEREPHCLGESVVERDRLAAVELGNLLAHQIGRGVVLRLDAPTLAALREAFSLGRTRAACQGCEWQSLCTSIAARGYEGARILAPELPRKR